MQSVHITLPEPCHENWDAMEEVEKGRICMSCQKTVVDFTVMTDDEMLQFLSQSISIPCGRFAPDQLNRTITPPRLQKFWHPYFFRFLLPAFLFTQRARANTFRVVSQQEQVISTTPFESHSYKTIVTGNILRGKITDGISGQPIAFARIKIKGLPISAMTDGKGLFTLTRVPNSKAWVLQVSSTSYQKREITIKTKHGVVNIQLLRDVKEMQDVLLYANLPYSSLNNGIPVYTKIVNLPGEDHSYKKINIDINYHSLPNSIIYMSMNNVPTGAHFLQLTDASGQLLQEHAITIPAAGFSFQWQTSQFLTEGIYKVKLLNAANKIVFNGSLTVE
jgi:CarboxypepD_reg-like domain